MLFIPQKPVKVKVTEDKKIIILTKTKIMFTNLDFIEEFLSMPIVGGQPQNLYYASQTMQVLVQCVNTLEIYYCDWKTQIKLKKVIILNNQPIYSVYFDQNTGWNIIGNLLQYEQPKVTYHQANNHFSEVIQKCYIGKSEYILTQNKLYKCLQGQSPLQVTWKDLKMVLKNCSEGIKMMGTKSSSKQKDIICINERYIIAIENFNVILTIQREKVLYIQNSLFISESDNGSCYNFNHLQHRSAVDLGSINKFQDIICAGRIYDDQIISLCFTSKQIKIRNLPLIQEKNTQNNLTKTRRLYNSISKIMERSNEEGSVFYNMDHHHQVPKVQVKKPIIRDIQVEGQELRQKSLKSENSQILERSGHTPKKRSDAVSIGDIKKKSDNTSKIEEQIILNDIEESQIQLTHSMKRMSEGISNQSSDDGKKHSFRVKKRHTDIGQGYNHYSNKFIKDSQKRNKHSEKNHSISAHSNSVSQEHYAQTPGFGNEAVGLGNDKWDHFEKQWDVQNDMDKVVEDEYEQSLVLADNERSILGKTFNMEENKKVAAFKPEGVKLTIDLAQEIQKTSYIKLMNEVYRKDIDKFSDLLNEFLWEIVEEKNCPLFFAEHIRAFSPQSTQDKVRRIFQPHRKKNNSKQKITQALKQFKICEVPSDFLKFSIEFIKITKVLYPDLYIGDILEPSGTTIEYILESYFNMETFSEQILLIENEQINITHPRNLLNVLLYLNETFQLNIVDIIKIYCQKIIAHNHLDIIKKLKEENIFQICGVPPSIITKVIVNRFDDLLLESVEHADYLWDLVSFLTDEVLEEYEMKLATIQELNKINMIYEVCDILRVKDPTTDIFVFLQTLISQNSSTNLRKLKLGNIYRSLFWLQQNEKLVYCTIEYIELVKQYAQKLIKDEYLHEAFLILDTVLSKIKKSYLAKLLYEHLDCKLLDKIASVSPTNLSYVFLEILNNEGIKASDIEHQELQNPEYSNHFACSWDHFLSIFRKRFEQPAEFEYFVYIDLPSAYELFSHLDEYKKSSFQGFMNDIRQSIVGEIEHHKMMDDDSLNPKGITNIMFLSKQEMQVSDRGTSAMRNEEYLLEPFIRERKNSQTFKSMTLIDHFMKVRKNSRANSEKQYENGSDDEFDELYRLKILVNEDQILESLKQIYETGTRKSFLKALTLIDMEKITLYHLDSYRHVASKGIAFKFQIIIPFIVFRIKNKKECFQKIKNKIQLELNLENFWLVWNIAELFFSEGMEVSKMLLKKIIYYFQSDKLGEVLNFILHQIKTLPSQEKQEYLNFTEENNLYNLNKILKNF